MKTDLDYQYVEAGNCKIAYLEKNKYRPETLFFIHGNSGSAGLWHYQYDDDRFADYRLICLDMPNHGHSAAIDTGIGINLLHIAAILAKAVDLLAAGKPYILIGFSLSANVVAEMLPYSLHPAGTVLLSPTIIGNGITLNDTLRQGADPTILFTDKPSPADVTRFIQELLGSTDQSDLSNCVEDFNAVEEPFRSQILKTAIDGKLTDEIDNLKQYPAPGLVVFGREDLLVDHRYLDRAHLPLWNNKIHILDKAGHYLMLNQPPALANLLITYCRQIFK